MDTRDRGGVGPRGFANIDQSEERIVVGTKKGLIVDFGGVLTTAIIESFAAFCQDIGLAPERLRDVLRSALDAPGADPSHVHLMETGKITEEDFNYWLAEQLSEGRDVPVDPVGLKERLFQRTRPEPAMVHAVIALRKAGIRTALVSNSWGGYGYPRETFDEMFDAVIISGEVGLRKPQPEIYLMAANKIGVEPSDCVFVDDFRVNVEGAEAIGMTAILHRDPAKTVEELERHFEVPLRIEGFLAGKAEPPPGAGLQSE